MSSDDLPGWYLEPYILLPFSSSLSSLCWHGNKKVPANQRIQFLNSIFTGAYVFLQALLIALCYTANCDLRGQTAHFYIITIPAQMMPFCLLLVQLLFPDGVQNLKVGLCGLVAAHLHDFLTRIYPEFGGGPNLIPTPWFMSYLVRTPRVENRAFGQVFNARKEKDDSGSGGPLPDAWKSRGSGRRLG